MNPKLEIPVGEAARITLQYDSPKIGQNSMGQPYYLYGVTVDEKPMSYFASEKAHEVLQYYTKNAVFAIEHKALDNGRTVYNVLPLSGSNYKKSQTTNQTNKSQDDSAEGKVRHGFALEAYRQGKKLDNDTIDEIDEWVSYVMIGKADTPF